MKFFRVGCLIEMECKIHCDNVCTHFCSNCNVLICPSCSIEEHQDNSHHSLLEFNLKDLSKVANNKRIVDEISRYIVLTQDYKKCNDQVISFFQDLIQHLSADQSRIIQSINRERENVERCIIYLYQKLNPNINNNNNNNKIFNYNNNNNNNINGNNNNHSQNNNNIFENNINVNNNNNNNHSNGNNHHLNGHSNGYTTSTTTTTTTNTNTTIVESRESSEGEENEDQMPVQLGSGNEDEMVPDEENDVMDEPTGTTPFATPTLAPLKRPRGRPKRGSTPPAPNAEAKRKRGRPKKTGDGSSSSVQPSPQLNSYGGNISLDSSNGGIKRTKREDRDYSLNGSGSSSSSSSDEYPLLPTSRRNSLTINNNTIKPDQHLEESGDNILLLGASGDSSSMTSIAEEELESRFAPSTIDVVQIDFKVVTEYLEKFKNAVNQLHGVDVSIHSSFKEYELAKNTTISSIYSFSAMESDLEQSYEVYDIIIDQWTKNMGRSFNKARDFARESIVLAGNHNLYAFGGAKSPLTLECFNMHSGQSVESPLNQLRGMGISACYDGERYIYLAGGHYYNNNNAKDIVSYDLVEQYDTHTNRFTTFRAHLERPVSRSLSIYHNRTIYLLGCTSVTSQQVGHLRSVLEINITSGECRSYPLMTKEHSSFANIDACCFDGTQYIYMISSKVFCRYDIVRKTTKSLAFPVISEYILESPSLIYGFAKGGYKIHLITTYSNFCFDLSNLTWSSIKSKSTFFKRQTSISL
ncbi:hypothetical protein DFA_05139 [Cavenderia fasciculata]|uniref:B box-type domain-containing protein n=1 Tax=Cavenderia fasciculata TaxID=261658 RepID=F4PNF6_CACFS|nr:uncharacterized protein DFA_05139 [Cavenderia fasciculata]EGG23009.1 hypothetical protein DFA_05139 [Cavenderia fasciculata]|eukprot:XP_004360860.1 hypothetical protein DFA_05139 [Cavenderia fasciculata]